MKNVIILFLVICAIPKYDLIVSGFEYERGRAYEINGMEESCDIAMLSGKGFIKIVKGGER